MRRHASTLKFTYLLRRCLLSVNSISDTHWHRFAKVHGPVIITKRFVNSLPHSRVSTTHYFLDCLYSKFSLQRRRRWWWYDQVKTCHSNATPIKTVKHNHKALSVRNNAVLLYPNPISSPNQWPWNPKTMSVLGYPKVIPYTKLEHFGIIRFWVMLRTNK